MTRIDGRCFDELRSAELITDFTRFPEGSVLIRMGNTIVLCNASVEEKVPPHVSSGGWITAEYSMLPRANRSRSSRDISKLKLAGRSAEIQRLIGRSLRSAVDLEKLGPRTITVDCDVLQGDGGTRTASVTGGFLALKIACAKLLQAGILAEDPAPDFVSAISAGLVSDEPLLDLCYEEDSSAQVDLNCVMDERGSIIELQATGEKCPFSSSDLSSLLELCKKGNEQLIRLQKKVFGDWIESNTCK